MSILAAIIIAGATQDLEHRRVPVTSIRISLETSQESPSPSETEDSPAFNESGTIRNLSRPTADKQSAQGPVGGTTRSLDVDSPEDRGSGGIMIQVGTTAGSRNPARLDEHPLIKIDLGEALSIDETPEPPVTEELPFQETAPDNPVNEGEAPPIISVWPSRSLGYQNGTPNSLAFRAGREDFAWFISGAYLGSQKNMSVDEFLDLPTSEIDRRFRIYLQQHSDLNSQTKGLVVLDLEHPVTPVDLGRVLPESDPETEEIALRRITDAFRRRFAVARALLPNAKLVVYGPGTPHPQGYDSEKHARAIRLMRSAAEMGFFENLDAMGPVLYPRFAEDEPGYSHWQRVFAQTMAITNRIRSGIPSGSRPIDDVPLLSFTIYNGNSSANNQPADLDDIARRLDSLHQSEIRTVIFWNADEWLQGSTTRVSDIVLQLDQIEEDRRVGVAGSVTTELP